MFILPVLLNALVYFGYLLCFTHLHVLSLTFFVKTKLLANLHFSTQEHIIPEGFKIQTSPADLRNTSLISDTEKNIPQSSFGARFFA